MIVGAAGRNNAFKSKSPAASSALSSPKTPGRLGSILANINDKEKKSLPVSPRLGMLPPGSEGMLPPGPQGMLPPGPPKSTFSTPDHSSSSTYNTEIKSGGAATSPSGSLSAKPLGSSAGGLRDASTVGGAPYGGSQGASTPNSPGVGAVSARVAVSAEAQRAVHEAHRHFLEEARQLEAELDAVVAAVASATSTTHQQGVHS